MKRTVFLFGSIAGLIVTAMMVFTSLGCYHNPDFKGSMVLGYAGMLAAFSFVFWGTKYYRDKIADGSISFGKAFQIGLYITLIASSMYVVTWLVEFYLFIPDFMEKYTFHVLKEAKDSGSNAAELEKKSAEMLQFSEWYKSPLLVILITYSEVLPIGLLITLFSSIILKRKAKP